MIASHFQDAELINFISLKEFSASNIEVGN
jgi:hypothetical protein